MEARVTDQDWAGRLSQPRHGVTEQRDQFVTMRDGVRLACNIFRPDGAGRFPALLSYSLYGKDVQKVREVQRPLSPRHGNGGQEAGDTGYFVSRGYVHVIADVRGAGDSEGDYNFQGRLEQQDGYDLVEWIAAQPWCDGNVGMLGMSYFAVVQNLVAATQPPHLKAIAPYEAYTDRYRHSVYQGGLLNEGFFHQWWSHVSIGTLRPLSFKYHSEEEINRRVAALKQTPEIQDSPYLHIQLKYPEKNPLMFDFLVEPNDGPYYWERSSYTMLDRIKVPALLMARWSAWDIHLAGAFQAWQGLTTPKKMIIFETLESTGPRRPWRDHQDIILRWYDHWLKGNDTGMMDEPPIRLLVKGRNEWRDEHEWPLRRTQWTKFFLNADGSLATAPTAEGMRSFTSEPFIIPGKPAPCLRFTTAPLERELEITGPSALYLAAAIDRPDASWIVSLKSQSPDGTMQVVTKGWLRASHRKLDPKRSKPYQPYHPHDARVPVPENEVLEYAIELRETSMAFPKGHRLVIEIRAQDTLADEPIWYHQTSAMETRHTLYCGGNRNSYLLLPVIPAANGGA
jgi:predicted acyl esterase